MKILTYGNEHGTDLEKTVGWYSFNNQLLNRDNSELELHGEIDT